MRGNMSILVSVLICTNRVDDFFVRALDSLVQQTYSNFEIVLVCNRLSLADKNKVEKISLDDSRIRPFFTSLGYLTFSLNLGLHYCRGELVARMDADDLAYPERLEKQVAFFAENSDVDVCGSGYDLIDNDDHVVGARTMPLSDRAIRQVLYWRNPLAHPTVMFRAAAIRELGGYMGALYAEDYDLWCRLALFKDSRFSNLNESLLGYRVAPTGLARKSKMAYAGVSASQWRSFVLTGDIRWLAAAVLSLVKRIFRAA